MKERNTLKKFHKNYLALAVGFTALLVIASGCSKLPTDPTSPDNPSDTTNTNIDNHQSEPVLPAYLSFVKDGKTFVATYALRGPEPYRLVDVKIDPNDPNKVLSWPLQEEVMRTGKKFQYYGKIDGWDYHVIDGTFSTFQVLGGEAQYANPGIGGNWVAEGVLDSARPYLCLGIYINPDPQVSLYYFVPPLR